MTPTYDFAALPPLNNHNQINSTSQAIRFLFEQYGAKHYGEGCSQLTHAISCAEHAEQDGADEAIILAAFLHDIGHFLADHYQMAGFDEWGHNEHAEIGADWLTYVGFEAGLVQPIRLHVAAKRYLAMDKQTLSHASETTLAQQGGAMTKQEACCFLADPYAKSAILLRKYDDLGKPEFSIKLDLIYWLKRIEQYNS